MKKTMIWVLILALLAIGAAAETEISVSGSGFVFVSSDTATVTLGVSARDRDVKKAQEKVNTAIRDITDALIGMGIPREDINTDRINIYVSYNYDDSIFGSESESVYNASNSLAIRTADIDKLGIIIDTAFDAGANMLDGIVFSADDTDAAEAEAMTMAVSDARKKADVLAAASGLAITGISKITEGYTSSYDSGVNNFSRATKEEAEADGVAGTMVQAAKLCVSSNITVVFVAEEAK